MRVTKKSIPYQDLHELSEDERIGYIGAQLMKMEAGQTIAVALDDDKEKIDRYSKKLLLRWPALIIKGVGPGLVENTVLLRITRK